MSNNLELLIRARELIEKPDDWCRGFLQDDAGRRCALGAMEKAHLEIRHYTPSLSLLPTLGFRKWEDVRDFNDKPSTKHTDVLRAFDRAIFEERVKCR